MPSQRIGLWLTAGLTVVGILWLAWAWSPRPTPSEPEPATPELDMPAAPTVAQPTAVEPPTVAKEVTAAPERTLTPSNENEAEVAPRVPSSHPMSLDQTRPPEAWGSLKELKGMYDTQSRQAESSERESKLRGLLASPNVPADLIDELSCRRTVCRLRLRWRPSRRLGYVVVLESLKQLYNQHVAVEPAGAQEPDGIYLTMLYVQLQ